MGPVQQKYVELRNVDLDAFVKKALLPEKWSSITDIIVAVLLYADIHEIHKYGLINKTWLNATKSKMLSYPRFEKESILHLNSQIDCMIEKIYPLEMIAMEQGLSEFGRSEPSLRMKIHYYGYSSKEKWQAFPNISYQTNRLYFIKVIRSEETEGKYEIIDPVSGLRNRIFESKDLSESDGKFIKQASFCIIEKVEHRDLWNLIISKKYPIQHDVSGLHVAKFNSYADFLCKAVKKENKDPLCQVIEKIVLRKLSKMVSTQDEESSCTIL